MKGFARGALAGIAGSLAVGVSLVTLTPVQFQGAVAQAKGQPELWHERGDAVPSALLPTGFTPLPSLAPLVKTLKPAVVSVSISSGPQRRASGQPDPFEDFFRHFFGHDPRRPGPGGSAPIQRSMGSGFIIHESGLVLTNNHVVDSAEKIDVKLADGREFKAEVVGTDPKTDVALLRLLDAKALPSVLLGNSDALEVGDWVIAIGNPFGLSHSVSKGIVSAKERFIGAGPYDDFIQTDAAINPGNSGGPLFNARGEVIGINTAIVGQGIGFAVPVNLVKALIPQLEEKGHVTRGWLGVAIQDLTPELARGLKMKNTRGALVSEVLPESPAAGAGLHNGDVIVSVDGKAIDSYTQLSRTIALLAPGTKITLGVLREGKPSTFKLAVAQRDDEKPLQLTRGTRGGATSESAALGLSVGAVTPEVARALDLPRAEGVVVTAVEPRGPAAAAGIARGDVVLEVNRRRVPNVKAFQEAMRAVQPGEMALLRLQRAGSAQYLALRTRRP